MANVLTAIGVLTSLLTQALQVSGLLKTAQASGVDITDAQLADLVNTYNAAVAKLNADISAAIASGR